MSMKGPPSTSSLLLLLLLLSSDPGIALPLPLSTTCCTQLYRKPLTHKLLRKVIRVELQEADGDCHLQAFVLHLDERSVCIHPRTVAWVSGFSEMKGVSRGLCPT